MGLPDLVCPMITPPREPSPPTDFDAIVSVLYLVAVILPSDFVKIAPSLPRPGAFDPLPVVFIVDTVIGPPRFWTSKWTILPSLDAVTNLFFATPLLTSLTALATDERMAGVLIFVCSKAFEIILPALPATLRLKIPLPILFLPVPV